MNFYMLLQAFFLKFLNIFALFFSKKGEIWKYVLESGKISQEREENGCCAVAIKNTECCDMPCVARRDMECKAFVICTMPL